MSKKKDKNLAKIQPSGVGEMDFGGEVSKYKTILKTEGALREKLFTQMGKIRVWFKENGFTHKEIVAVSQITFYEKEVKVDKNSKAYRDVMKDSNFGSKIFNLINDKYSKIGEYLGKQSLAELEKVAMAYAIEYHCYEKKEDRELTSKKRKEYQELVDVVEDTETKLVELRSDKDSSKDFVAYIKDLASIARASRQK